MRTSLRSHRLLMLAAVAAFVGCGDDSGTDPTDVTFGETTFVIVVNPPLNDDNEASVPAPGSVRSGVSVAVQGGPSGTTDANGVVVLSDVEPGNKTILLSSATVSGSITVAIEDQDLREVAVALTSSGAEVMTTVLYAFGGQVVEVTPSMSLTEVNAALAQSNRIVFFGAGSYTGNLVFAGSNVTLFGEGAQGGQVTLNGSVEVGGSNNRIRGARITADLSVPASDFGFSFSRVEGDVDLAGSDATLLQNGFCGTVTISGSGATVLGNAGMAPLGQPTGC